MNAKQQSYFKILGIPPTNDKGIIKKAYRKKAFQYHPDRNKLPSAHDKFIKLTEAYEYLLEGPKPRKKSGFTATKTAEEVLAERMRRARERYQQAQKKEAEEEIAYFNELTTGRKGQAFKYFGFVALFVGLLWFADYTILSANAVSFELDARYGTEDVVCNFIDGEEFCFYREDLAFTNSKMKATAYFSAVFNDLLYVDAQWQSNILLSGIKPLSSFARSFPYFLPFLLIPFLAYLFRRSSIGFTAAYLFSITVVAFMLLFRVIGTFV